MWANICKRSTLVISIDVKYMWFNLHVFNIIFYTKADERF